MTLQSSSPRSCSNHGSSMPRARVPRGSLAHLVSRFEILDAMSTVEHSAPTTIEQQATAGRPDTPRSGSVAAGSVSKDMQAPLHIELDTAASTTNSSQVSSGRRVSRGHRVSPQHVLSPSTPQSRTSIAPVDPEPSKTFDSIKRQTSVAERRKLFEVGLGGNASSGQLNASALLSMCILTVQQLLRPLKRPAAQMRGFLCQKAGKRDVSARRR